MEQETPTPPAYSEQSPEERKQYNAVKQRQTRERKKLREAAAAAATEAEFWKINRKTLDPAKSAEMIELHERCLDQLHWMAKNPDPNDQFFQDDLEEFHWFVQMHPCPHLGYITKNDIPTDWSTSVWHNGKKYWQDEKLLNALCDESPATEQYVLRGYFSGLPDWRVIRFLMDKIGWTWQRAATLVGQSVDHLGEVHYKDGTTVDCGTF